MMAALPNVRDCFGKAAIIRPGAPPPDDNLSGCGGLVRSRHSPSRHDEWKATPRNEINFNNNPPTGATVENCYLRGGPSGPKKKRWAHDRRLQEVFVREAGISRQVGCHIRRADRDPVVLPFILLFYLFWRQPKLK
jgi:hypothetical protein